MDLRYEDGDYKFLRNAWLFPNYKAVIPEDWTLDVEVPDRKLWPM
jgi:hypothetical protein